MAQIILPAIGTLYMAVASIWGLGYVEQVVGTITAIDAFLGAILGISTHAYINSDDYGEGTIQCVEGDPDSMYLVLNKEVKDIMDQKTASFKVNKEVKTNG